MKQDAQAWAEQVFGGCELGDRRLTDRLVRIGSRLAGDQGACLNRVFADDPAGRLGAYRFMESDRVDPEDIAAGGFAATAARAADCALMVCIQDTTTASFKHSAAAELGDVGGPEQTSKRGWLIHSSLLLDASNGMPVGLIDQAWWTRRPEDRGRKYQRKQRAYADKESYKWQTASQLTAERLGEHLDRVVTVCDREADIYEFLEYNLAQGRRFVVRVACNRALTESDQRIWGALQARPALGRAVVRVKQRGGRRARVAQVELRSAQVELAPPSRKNGARPRPITLWAVLVSEVAAPAEVEPLEWLLWTMEPAETLAQADQVRGLYAWRWRIEDYHKAWKSGCGLEEMRLATADHLRRLGTILAFVAVRLLWLREWSQSNPQGSCTRVFEEDEWRCLWLSTERGQPLPRRAPRLDWAYRALGRLGGWTDTARTGRVGWLALWRGWFRLQDRLIGWRLARDM